MSFGAADYEMAENRISDGKIKSGSNFPKKLLDQFQRAKLSFILIHTNKYTYPHSHSHSHSHGCSQLAKWKRFFLLLVLKLCESRMSLGLVVLEQLASCASIAIETAITQILCYFCYFYYFFSSYFWASKFHLYFHSTRTNNHFVESSTTTTTTTLPLLSGWIYFPFYDHFLLAGRQLHKISCTTP